MAKFKPGQSGNPGGRPKGKTPLAEFREAVGPHMPEVWATMAEAAKNGDTAAASLLANRYCPAPRPTLPPINLPLPADPAEAARLVVQASGDGRIPVEVGEKLMAMLTNMARIGELDELRARIEALENRRDSDRSQEAGAEARRKLGPG
jgi:hypothetical protein